MKVYKLVKTLEESTLTENTAEELVNVLVNDEDYFQYIFSFENENRQISLKDTFTIKVNIKDCGSILISLPLEGLDKSEVLAKIKELRSIQVTDNESSKAKVKALLENIKEFKPYFVVYQAKNGFPLTEEEVKGVLKEAGLEKLPYFFVEKKEEPLPVEEEKKEEVPAPVEENDKWGKAKEFFKKCWAQFKVDLGNIAKNKYHFLFIIISTFLFVFASAVGVCNAYGGKNIAALFFVCAGVGLFLDTYVYKDYFEIKSIKDRLFVYSLVFNVIGIGIGLGATMLFYFFDKSGIQSFISVKTLSLISLGMGFGMIALSVGLAYLINFLFKKFKKPQEEEKKEDAPAEEEKPEVKEETSVEESPKEEAKEEVPVKQKEKVQQVEENKEDINNG